MGEGYFTETVLLDHGKTLIVLPQVMRIKALQMAHDLPIAGYFGRERER